MTGQPDPSIFAGDRVRAARLLRGVSQTSLAKSLGLTQGAISQIESGRLSPSGAQIDAIALALNLPRSFFDAVPPDLPPVTLRFRKQSRASATDTNRATQLVAEAYRIVWTLVHERDGYLPPSLPLAIDQVVTDDDIEQLAAATRTTLGLDAASPVRHMTRALERAGVVVAPLSLSDDEDHAETVGHFGASCWPGPGDPALIGYFHGAAGDRQRFTLAHEVGHLVLHSRRTFVADPEGEANRFAGALLVPRDAYQEFMGDSAPTLRDFAMMKAKWGVSIQALIMRGSHLGLIDETRKTSLFKQISARGYRKNEPVNVHPEEPVLFAKLIESRYGSTKNVYTLAGPRVGLDSFMLAGLAPRRAAR